jgi:signal transduction histidine kinase
VQDLSAARDLGDVTRTVRRAARELGSADGATFILRDGSQCHYVDEDAIGPLWKGQRFPLENCVSGWSMLHRAGAVIPDIERDPRVPIEAYRSTFVRSMAMVPIRIADPIGAIGIYWSSHHEASEEEVQAFQSLANAAAVAMENVRLIEDLDRRVQERTRDLVLANHELKAFTHTVSHDLRAPLRAIMSYAELATLRHGDAMPPDAVDMLRRIKEGGRRMNALMESLLQFSAVARQPLARAPVPMGDVVREVVEELRRLEPEREVEVAVADDLPSCEADATLMRQVLANLLGNAFKSTRRQERPRIEVSGARGPAETAYTVRDNGIGFDMEKAQRLFEPFETLHQRGEFPGTGIGLSIVQRIVERHGGRVWAEGEPGRGAAFHFTVPVQA